jgi:hypothetical protein
LLHDFNDPRVGKHLFRRWTESRVDPKTEKNKVKNGGGHEEEGRMTTARLFDEIFHGIAPMYFCFVFELRWLDVKKIDILHFHNTEMKYAPRFA